jgi:hypothetical protein
MPSVQDLRNLPLVGSLLRAAGYVRFKLGFQSSRVYWQQRYATGGNSGSGSYQRLALFKAEVLNDFVHSNHIQSVVEFGCGDGNQLVLAAYPSYLGFDVSLEALTICKSLFVLDHTKQFRLLETYQGEQAELALSLDVIYHLVEDVVFEDYMRRLFNSATRFVIIYSSNTEQNPILRPPHVRHRCFTAWVEQHARDWVLKRHVPNRFPLGCDDQVDQQSFADFFIYTAPA